MSDWLKFRESVTRDPSISLGHTNIFQVETCIREVSFLKMDARRNTFRLPDIGNASQTSAATSPILNVLGLSLKGFL